MLNYLVDSTEQLMTMMLLLGFLFAFVETGYTLPQRKRILQIGLAVGFVAAAAMAYIKHATSFVDTSFTNLIVYFITIGVMAVLCVFIILAKKKPAFGGWAVSITVAVEIALLMFYFLPFYLESPRTIALSEDSILSSDFLLKLICDLGGLLITFIAALSIYKVCTALGKRCAFVFMVISQAINLVRMICAGLGVMLTKRLIASNHTIFLISKYASNYSDAFIYAVMLTAFAAVIMLLVRSLHVNEPYTNPAEHRKIRAKWRNRRRWSVAIITCFILAVLNLTAIDAYANRAVELSPVEACDVHDGAMYIPFEQVNDGHLHRFAYVTDEGVQIRFIVIQKPNSSSYGIGLDACDVCGETGYYEKDGQVVCNLCDVVMNINTIGFKGGCNPIIIDYSIDSGYIIVPIDGLLEHVDEFK